MLYQRFIQIKNGRVIEFYSIYPVIKAKEIEPKINQMQGTLVLNYCPSNVFYPALYQALPNSLPVYPKIALLDD